MTRALLMLAAALALAGCGGGQRATAETPGATVDIRTFAFQPDPLMTAPGTEVTFVNHDAILHTVTAGTRKQPGKRFDEKLPPSTGKATITFDEPGRYRYFCSVHPGDGMTGQVVVG